MPTGAQPRAAIARAHAVRVARGHVKEGLRLAPSMAAAREAKAKLVERPPDVLHTMRVFDLLRSGRQHGEATARRLLRSAGISELATVGGLTDRQRRALTAALGGVPRPELAGGPLPQWTDQPREEK